MRTLVGILASLTILWAAAPLGAGERPPGTEPPPEGPPVVLVVLKNPPLTTAPLGAPFHPGSTTQYYWVASVVNVGSHSVTATIEFCDEAGACFPDLFGACSAVLLEPRKGCSITTSRLGGGFQYARMFVFSGNPINVRGALQFEGDFGSSIGPTIGAVEAQ